MVKRNRIYLCFLCLFVVILLGNLSFQLYDTTRTKKKIEIIYIPKIVDETNEFWSSVIAGAKMAAKEYDVNLTIMAPKSETDIDGQNQMILEAIGYQPDALVVSPSSFEATTSYVKKAAEKGIKLVLIDSEVNEDVADAIVATDNIQAGQKLGTYMKEYLPEHPKIGFVGHVEGTSTAIEREKGIRKGLGEDSRYVVDVVFCDSIYQTAYDVTKQLLSRYPDINMIAGFNEYSSLGAATAIRDLGMQERIATFGIDSSVAQIQLLEAGVYQGIVIQNPFNMGYLGIEQAVKSIWGERTEARLDSGSKLITKDNMYSEENEKLLFPFLGRQATEKEQIQRK